MGIAPHQRIALSRQHVLAGVAQATVYAQEERAPEEAWDSDGYPARGGYPQKGSFCA